MFAEANPFNGNLNLIPNPSNPQSLLFLYFTCETMRINLKADVHTAYSDAKPVTNLFPVFKLNKILLSTSKETKYFHLTQGYTIQNSFDEFNLSAYCFCFTVCQVKMFIISLFVRSKCSLFRCFSVQNGSYFAICKVQMFLDLLFVRSICSLFCCFSG